MSLIIPCTFFLVPAADNLTQKGISTSDSRNVTIMLDRTFSNNAYNETVSYSDIVRMLKSHLLSGYSDHDSFNIFYLEGSTVYSVNNDWMPMTSYMILNAFNRLPANIISSSKEIGKLITEGYNFSKT